MKEKTLIRQDTMNTDSIRPDTDRLINKQTHKIDKYTDGLTHG